MFETTLLFKTLTILSTQIATVFGGTYLYITYARKVAKNGKSFFGYYFRWEGVILGSSLAVIIGSLYLIISYRIDNESIFKMINLKLTMQSFFVTLI